MYWLIDDYWQDQSGTLMEFLEASKVFHWHFQWNSLEASRNSNMRLWLMTAGRINQVYSWSSMKFPKFFIELFNGIFWKLHGTPVWGCHLAPLDLAVNVTCCNHNSYRRIQEKNKAGRVNRWIKMKMHQKSFQFDETMDFCCRLLKKDKIIESHEFCKIGGFKKVKLPNGKYHSIKCLDDLWKIVPEGTLKREMIKRDKSGILSNNGLKFVH